MRILREDGEVANLLAIEGELDMVTDEGGVRGAVEA